MVGSGQLASSESYSNTSYLSSAPPIPKPPIIPKTVDYGHGHGMEHWRGGGALKRKTQFGC